MNRKNLAEELYDSVNMFDAAIEIFEGLVNNTVDSEIEKENAELKANIIKEEIIKQGVDIVKVLDKIGV